MEKISTPYHSFDYHVNMESGGFDTEHSGEDPCRTIKHFLNGITFEVDERVVTELFRKIRKRKLRTFSES